MKLLARSIPIDCALTPKAIESQACQLSRYHLIMDLAHKGPAEIQNFQRCFDEGHDAPKPVRLRLITILATASGVDHDPLPIFDFIGIESDATSAYGIMFSTYFHDLHRDAINTNSFTTQPFTRSSAIARIFMESLFMPSAANDGIPPYPGKPPVFVFPATISAHGKDSLSATDAYYMSLLGFKMQRARTKPNSTVRSYRHLSDAGSDGNTLMDSIVMALGHLWLQWPQAIHVFWIYDCSHLIART